MMVLLSEVQKQSAKLRHSHNIESLTKIDGTEEFLTVAQASRFFDIDKNRIYQWIHRGKIERIAKGDYTVRTAEIAEILGLTKEENDDTDT